MSYKDFYNDIENDNIASLYLLYGPESLLVDRLVDQLADKILAPGVRSFNYIEKDGETLGYDEAFGLIERLPMMDQRQIVVIREPLFLAKADWDDAQVMRFIEYHQKQDTTITILIAKQIDKRKSAFKQIKKVGKIIEFDHLDERTLCKWMMQEANKLDKQLDMSLALQLAQRTGYGNQDSEVDLYGILTMLQKLCYQSNQTKISAQVLDDVLDHSEVANIFKMIDALFEGRATQAFRQLTALTEAGEVPIKIAFMIQRHIRQLISVNILLSKGYSNKVVANRLSLKPFVVNKAAGQLRRLDKGDLSQLLERAIVCDLQTKSSLDAQIAVEALMATVLASVSN